MEAFGTSNDISSDARTKEFVRRIEKLKQEMRAIILAHYYTVPEVQDVADIVGDSLALARAAESTEADVIVFAGVYFMGETASILNPDKLVLMPDDHAGCPLADSCPTEEFRAFKRQYPDALVISYINSTAEIKAESDIICTSSNAERIVRQVPEDKRIIFGPDRNLGGYVMRKLNRKMILWQGYCYVHEAFNWEVVKSAVEAHPGAELIAHPECREDLLQHADFIGSTSGLLEYAGRSSSETFIVATEPGILHEMRKRSPQKTFIPAPKDASQPWSTCTQMKQNTLEKLLRCMESRQPQIVVEESLRQAALKSIRRMLEMS
ncbi:quinolinate synthase NadA [Prosthecochloris sp. SCSIO W1103]|uniref:quinolinate synthase NadA n=1 Tax=Prosthecochloris sp. SCSIO W1103 TaxID=2992244 RepID=UPI00223E4A78|nr:quinolinate synthase NadA [Prosthecochloris sp. SCSIO W1103]UZJ38263.1 quinolinate synthase NadA [Prosthecochloris sp. SCSIO W1103]